MPSGNDLMKESETRFGTTFAVVERFLKAKHEVHRLVFLNNTHAATDAMYNLVNNSSMTNEERYPCLVALKEAFAPVVHVQTKLETRTSPCMHLVLPMLVHLKHKLKEKANGISNRRTMEMPNVHTQRLCGVVLNVVSDI